MKSRIFLCALASGMFSFGQELTDSTQVELQGVEITQKLPLTSERISKSKLNQRNLGQDMASLLQNATSVVNTSDAGTGIGYSSIRIRGMGQDHININLNGVALNDPESHNVFWVNMPDLASNSQSVLIQRGVGTSTSGSAAFGAIINIDGNQPARKPFMEINNSYGTFNSRKHSLKLGSGRFLNDRLSVDAHVSLIKSDGYIDRAFSDLFSTGLNAQYQFNSRSSLRYWTFFGKEKTYQAWNGINGETLKNNRRFNPAGAIYNSDYTEIVDYYKNETDNYRQHHNHLIWEQKFGSNWQSNTTFFYVRGKGFYENYKQDSKLYKFKLDLPFEKSDVVRKKWLDNHSYGLNQQIENQKLGNWEFFSGFSFNRYENKHYGEITWIKNLENQMGDWEFYRNKAVKDDFSIFAKALYHLEDFEFYGDLQYRFVHYKTDAPSGGENEYENFFAFKDQFNFINPKLGLNYKLNRQNQFYFYYGMAHREPIRSDYMDNGKMLEAEKMHDFELGYKKTGRLNLSSNLYYMYYLNQLVATGQLNETGNYIRTNSGKSFRTGIELDLNYGLSAKWKLFGNLTYSINQNQDYSEVVFDEDWNESLVHYGKTKISFSPDWIGSAGIEFSGIENLNLALISKYVGSQYLTNTELKDGKLDDYFLTDFILNYRPKWLGKKDLEFNLLINNLFDKSYESNGFYYEEAYYYPQAGIQIMGGMKISL